MKERSSVRVIQNVSEMQDTARRLRAEGLTIGFVPTMGYLHEGHLSLVREAASRADMVVVSIFVNPTQFGPNEDLDAYPRDLDRDLALAADAGANIVFTPTDAHIYGKGFQTFVQLEHLPGHLCGLSRPGHFRGVATVVTKLFHIVHPHLAVFGEKDYQQLVIIRRLVEDLNFGIRIIGGPIVREPDGLAMSSRNAYLTADQRASAPILFKTLTAAAWHVATGERDAGRILDSARASIVSVPGARIDYIAVVDPESLDPVETVDRPARMALAIFFGTTRLIDNLLLEP